jgi:hypothetical protein
MATVASPRKASKSAKPFTCSIITLTVEINDARYSVDEIPAGECGTKAFRLTKHSARDGGTYDVIRQHDGIVACSCPDYIGRHQGNGYGLCKHGRSLVELGLMAAPLAPEFAPAKGVHTVNALPVVAPEFAVADRIPNDIRNYGAPTEVAPEFAPADRIPDAIRNAGAPTEVEPAPEPCCPESEPAPCLACLEASVDGLQMEDRAIEAAPVARCVCEACVDDAQCVEAEAEDAGPAEAWGPEWDIDAWMLGADAPEPEPDGPTAEDLAEAEMSARELLNPAGPPTLTLAELVEKQVQFYLAWQTDAGDLIAGQLDQLASRIRFLDARSPAEFSARGDVMDRDDRDATYRQGFEAALAERRAMEAASAFGHGV